MIAGGLLLFPGIERSLGQTPLWDVGSRGGYIIVWLMFAGLAFSWWARIHLGRLWSSTITRKEGHRIVDTGPYGLVRHPIYTGLIAALSATAAVDATITALIGAALVIFGLFLKASSEERFLMLDLGVKSKKVTAEVAKGWRVRSPRSYIVSHEELFRRLDGVRDVARLVSQAMQGN